MFLLQNLARKELSIESLWHHMITQKAMPLGSILISHQSGILCVINVQSMLTLGSLLSVIVYSR